MNIYTLTNDPTEPTIVIENEYGRIVIHRGFTYTVDHLFIFPEENYTSLGHIENIANDHQADHPELKDDERLFINSLGNWYIFWFSGSHKIKPLESKYEVKNVCAPCCREMPDHANHRAIQFPIY